ncbi:MAG: sodium:solute symporter family protein [Candidatus Delongbacteria bacterium]|nr:sodium:solute symporter family protein [Candidatus Delongbacteria bacterium]
MNEPLALPALLVIIGYFLVVVWLGLRRTGSHQSADSYLLASRRLTLPFFIATLVSTWYGGILGVGEFSYNYGLVNWLALGGFYYAFALVYALLLAQKVRQGADLTIPGRLADNYGSVAGRFSSLFVFILVTPAPYLLMMAKLLSLSFGIGFPLALLLTLLVTVTYVWRGGFKAVVVTDLLQFFLMFAGFAVLLGMLYHQFGGIEFIRQRVPAELLTIPGPLGWREVLIWGFIALWTLVDPSFYQRVCAVDRPATARRGLIISILFWFVFDFMTTAAGLYARALLPVGIDPTLSYPLLAQQFLPVLLQGVFFAALLATIMSTLDSYTFLAALTLAVDLETGSAGSTDLDRIRCRTRWGLLWTVLFSLLMIYYTESVIQMWLTVGQLCIPVLLLPLLSTYFPLLRRSSTVVFTAMVAAAVASAGWFAWGLWQAVEGWPVYPLGIEPIYPGLLISVVVFGLRIKKHTPRHGETESLVKNYN